MSRGLVQLVSDYLSLLFERMYPFLAVTFYPQLSQKYLFSSVSFSWSKKYSRLYCTFSKPWMS